MPQTLKLVYEDADLLVLDKPAGLLCVPGRGPDKQDCLSARVQAQFADALIVHRLDMATSGLVVMARGAHNQRRLSEAFAQRLVQKSYIAQVQGDALALAGNAATDALGWHTIDLPVGADWPQRPLQKVDWLKGKPSQTRWRIWTESAMAAGVNPFQGLLLEPVTGRTHQLRLHLASVGLPILGDSLYAPPAVAAASNRLMLHAWQLMLPHPQTTKMIKFKIEKIFKPIYQYELNS